MEFSLWFMVDYVILNLNICTLMKKSIFQCKLSWFYIVTWLLIINSNSMRGSY